MTAALACCSARESKLSLRYSSFADMSHSFACPIIDFQSLSSMLSYERKRSYPLKTHGRLRIAKSRLSKSRQQTLSLLLKKVCIGRWLCGSVLWSYIWQINVIFMKSWD